MFWKWSRIYTTPSMIKRPETDNERESPDPNYLLMVYHDFIDLKWARNEHRLVEEFQFHDDNKSQSKLNPLGASTEQRSFSTSCQKFIWIAVIVTKRVIFRWTPFVCSMNWFVVPKCSFLLLRFLQIYITWRIKTYIMRQLIVLPRMVLSWGLTRNMPSLRTKKNWRCILG